MNLDNSDAGSAELLKLCCHVTGLPAESISSVYEQCLQIVGRARFSPSEKDETQVAEKIIRCFIKGHKEKEAVRFSDLYRKLRSPALSGVLQNRASVLEFLLAMHGEGTGKPTPFLNQHGSGGAELAQMSQRIQPDMGSSSHSSHERGPLTASPKVCQAEVVGGQGTQGVTGLLGQDLLREVVFSLQGISGTIVQFLDDHQGLLIDPEVLCPFLT